MENLCCQRTLSLIKNTNSNFLNFLNISIRWSNKQPDDVGGKQNCLAVDIFGTSYGFRDEDCSASFRYICYAKETTGLTTPGRNAQRDCAFNFGINESNIQFE